MPLRDLNNTTTTTDSSIYLRDINEKDHIEWLYLFNNTRAVL